MEQTDGGGQKQACQWTVDRERCAIRHSSGLELTIHAVHELRPDSARLEVRAQNGRQWLREHPQADRAVLEQLKREGAGEYAAYLRRRH